MSEEMLDESVFESNAPDSSNYASAGQRFLTYLIDLVIYYVIIFVFGLIIGMTSGGILAIVPLLAFFAYYAVMEHMLGQTVGKMIMKTRVVNVDGGQPSLGQTVIRTLCRMVPLEFISVWIGDGVMWHDKWASTRVIKD